MATGINVPLEVAAALSAGSLGLGAGIAVWAGKWRNRRMAPAKADAEADPLGPLFRPTTLSRLINRAERRQPRGGRAVLHGHIGGLAALEAQWDAPTHAAVRAQIAAVMRASLRRDDRIALGDGTFGEGFTIFVPGADKQAGVRIAQRLGLVLSRLRLPRIGRHGQLAASFGVAAAPSDEDAVLIARRARRALEAARVRGSSEVITASSLAEPIGLPTPSARRDPEVA
ncbi:MAG: GGDEF domain-containing protein [Erythrobacter cryptus]